MVRGYPLKAYVIHKLMRWVFKGKTRCAQAIINA